MTSGGHANAELVRCFHDAQRRGDVALLMEMLADDVVWHVPGRNLLSRDYNGKAEVGGFWARARELSGGTVRTELIEVLGGDDFGIALVRVFAEREGKSLGGQFQAFTYRIRDGKSPSSGSWWRTAIRSTHSGLDPG